MIDLHCHSVCSDGTLTPEELAEKAGVPKGRIVSIEIDRARILKAKEDYEHLKMVMRQLKARKDLTDEQKAEVKGMDW